MACEQRSPLELLLLILQHWPYLVLLLLPGLRLQSHVQRALASVAALWSPWLTKLRNTLGQLTGGRSQKLRYQCVGIWTAKVIILGATRCDQVMILVPPLVMDCQGYYPWNNPLLRKGCGRVAAKTVSLVSARSVQLLAERFGTRSGSLPAYCLRQPVGYGCKPMRLSHALLLCTHYTHTCGMYLC